MNNNPLATLKLNLFVNEPLEPSDCRLLPDFVVLAVLEPALLNTRMDCPRSHAKCITKSKILRINQTDSCLCQELTVRYLGTNDLTTINSNVQKCSGKSCLPRSTNTGGKGWFPELVHHKSITRTWTKYQAKTHLVHPKSIQNIPSQFPCSVPGSGNGQYICSVPGHVTRMFPSGTPWEHLKFSQRKYLENTQVAHSEFPL